MGKLTVSVVIPARDAGPELQQCLDALARCQEPPEEIIVVDDGSSDGAVRAAERMGVRVLRNGKPEGPALARNRGARLAQGDILLFLDADVVPHPDVVERVRRRFEQDPSLGAVMGSYDDTPAQLNFVSQYKNLSHCYFHRRGKSDASGFWSGCGAIRRELFLRHGGFDSSYDKPSIEDVDLGYRLRRAGEKLVLDPSIQGTHTKRWTLLNVIRTDTLRRAAPWTELILRYWEMPNDLNLGATQRAALSLTCLAAALAPVALLMPWIAGLLAGAVALACLFGVAWLNAGYLRFLRARRGAWFVARAFPLFLLYYLCGGVGFLVGALRWGKNAAFRLAARWLGRRGAVFFGVSAAAMVLGWQALAVHGLYGGNWTALYYTGIDHKLPAALESATYRWQGSHGYDGQYYRHVAHDPLLSGTMRGMDVPALRYRRILVPGLAWLLAGGNPALIDYSYVAVIALAVFAGAAWLSLYARSVGGHPAWGWLFLFLPATLISMQRLTVDVALAALCVAYLLYADRGGNIRLFLVLAAACLTRETGLVVAAAGGLHFALSRNWRRVALCGISVFPALLWYAFVAGRLSAIQAAPQPILTIPGWIFRPPLLGIFLRILSPVSYPYSGAKLLAVHAADVLAWSGVLIGLTLTVWWCRRKPWQAGQAGALSFALLTATVSARGFWADVNGWGRTLTPFYLFLAAARVQGARWPYLLPLVLADLRLSLQLQSELFGALRALLMP